MQIYYYYHIPKTGGTTMVDFLIRLTENLPNSKYYNFNAWDNIIAIQKDIDFNEILSTENIYTSSSWLLWINAL